MSDEQESQSPDDPRYLRGKSFSGSGYQPVHCLVVARNSGKREMIARAAAAAGWKPMVYSDAASAMSPVHRARFEMAWIDFYDSAEMDVEEIENQGWSDLCAAIAGLPHVLLAVCGQEQDASEETWARQLGVWLYVPGLSVDDQADVTVLCEQAQLVVNGSHASY